MSSAWFITNILFLKCQDCHAQVKAKAQNLAGWGDRHTKGKASKGRGSGFKTKDVMKIGISNLMEISEPAPEEGNNFY